jgi:outer membrane protein assembly factor BamB
MSYRENAETVLVAAANGEVLARELRSGRRRWIFALPRTPDAPVATVASALTRVAVSQGVVLVFGVETVVARKRPYGFAAVHVLVALDVADGRVLWRNVLYEADQAHPPGTLLVEDGVAVATTAYATAAYEIAGGQLLWAEKNPPLRDHAEGISPACGVALAVAGNAVQADAAG